MNFTAESVATAPDGQRKTDTATLSQTEARVQRASSSTEGGLAGTCWAGRADGGRNFYMRGNGTSYRVYLDCTNGRHLFPEVYSGEWEFHLTGPEGARAIWGGSW